jgi:hypothetical protein
MENRTPTKAIVRGPDQIRRGIKRLQSQISELEAFDPSVVSARGARETRAIQAAISETLAETFGDRTSEHKLYASAARLDKGPIYLSGRPPVELVVEWIQDGKEKSLALLNRAVENLEEDLKEFGEKPSTPAAEQPRRSDSASADQDGAEGKIEMKLRLISAAAVFLSTCVLIFHGRTLKSKVREPTGVVFCKKCSASIAVSNPSAVQQDFSATCPACLTKDTYKRIDLNVA